MIVTVHVQFSKLHARELARETPPPQTLVWFLQLPLTQPSTGHAVSDFIQWQAKNVYFITRTKTHPLPLVQDHSAHASTCEHQHDLQPIICNAHYNNTWDIEIFKGGHAPLQLRKRLNEMQEWNYKEWAHMTHTQQRERWHTLPT